MIWKLWFLLPTYLKKILPEGMGAIERLIFLFFTPLLWPREPPWVPPNIEIISGNAGGAALLWWRSLALGTGSNGVLESFHLAFYWDNGGKCANSAITSTWKRWCDSSALLLFYCFFLSPPSHPHELSRSSLARFGWSSEDAYLHLDAKKKAFLQKQNHDITV